MFTSKIYSKWMKEAQVEKYNGMKEILPELKGRVLDVGIGPGWFEEFFGINAIGTDVDKNSKADIIAHGDFLPFRNEVFDFVVCIDTVHLLEGNDIKRVLKKCGKLVISHFLRKEEDVEKKLLNMFHEFKLLEKKIVGNREKDLVFVMQKGPVV